MIASPRYWRESLIPELHRAADDMGEWALLHTQSMALGLVDNNLHRLAQEEAMRDKVLTESVQHYMRCRWCDGKECAAPKCHELSAEMAVYVSEAPPRTALGAMREWLRDLLDDWRAR